MLVHREDRSGIGDLGAVIEVDIVTRQRRDVERAKPAQRNVVVRPHSHFVALEIVQPAFGGAARDDDLFILNCAHEAKRSCADGMEAEVAPRAARHNAEIVRDVSAEELRALFDGEFWILSARTRSSGAGFVLKRTLESALSAANGQISEAARMLRISRATFYKKLAKFGLAVSDSTSV